MLAVFGFAFIVMGMNQPQASGMGILIGWGLVMLWLAWTQPKPKGISRETLRAIHKRSRERLRANFPEDAAIMDEIHPLQ